jgi:hypothetical protein
MLYFFTIPNLHMILTIKFLPIKFLSCFRSLQINKLANPYKTSGSPQLSLRSFCSKFKAEESSEFESNSK